MLLGPQGQNPNLGTVFDSLSIPEGPVAAVTAGWQEREGEDEELDHYLRGRSFDLELYRRADQAFHEDKELAAAHREMQRRLRMLEGLYDTRLTFAIGALSRLEAETGDRRVVEPEVEHAMRQLRELDSRHMERVLEIRGEFEETWRPTERDAVAKQRTELAKLLKDAPAVVITGGHVAVLLNRLRLFSLTELMAEKTIIAWSAGAMALTERVVLFHDRPPQGPGNAEVLERGMGLCPGLLALPHGRKRLDLTNDARVSRFARRFHPDAAIVMGAGDRIDWDGKRWRAQPKVERLSPEGHVESVWSW